MLKVTEIVFSSCAVANVTSLLRLLKQSYFFFLPCLS